MFKEILKKSKMMGVILLVLAVCATTALANSNVKVQLLSPQPNSNVEIDDVIIVFSVLQDMEKVELSGITLELDGIDVSPSVQLNQGIISFLPVDIKLGSHTVLMKIVDTTSKTIKPVTFSFNVVPSTVKIKTRRTTPIIRFSGSNTMSYQANDTTGPGASARQEPSSSNSLSLTATGSYKGINYEGTANISSESDFDRQPSDTYSFKVYTEWGGMVAGDNFPSFSQIAMTGNRVRGASVYAELDSNIGKVRVDGVYGVAMKRIEASSTPERIMQAVNASYNMDEKFKINLLYMNAKDTLDDIALAGADYQENTVFGAALEYTPSYDLNVKVEYAQSDTVDLQTDKSAEVEVTGDAFIGNNAALDSSVSANLGGFYSLNAEYSITGVNFKSFGNPWMRTDIQKLSATNTFRFFANKLTVSATVSAENDNLSEQLATTTTTTSYSGYSTLALGTSLPTLTANYMLNKTQSEDTSLTDLSADRETVNWSATVSEMLQISSYSMTLRANYGENNSSDLINPLYDMDSKNYGGGVNLTLPNYATLGTNYSISENIYSSTNSSTTTDTFTVNASYPLIEQILTLTGSYTYNKQTNSEATVDTEKNALSFSISWTINQFQRLYASYNNVKYDNLLSPDTSNYTSNSFSLNYSIMFDGFSY